MYVIDPIIIIQRNNAIYFHRALIIALSFPGMINIHNRVPVKHIGGRMRRAVFISIGNFSVRVRTAMQLLGDLLHESSPAPRLPGSPAHGVINARHPIYLLLNTPRELNSNANTNTLELHSEWTW